MEKKAQRLAQLLRVLANENRLMIFCALMEGAKTVGEIAEKVPGITQSALSQHLAILKAHGILDFTKKGRSITYCIADHRVEEIINVLQKYYCDSEQDRSAELKDDY
ncbi:MAG: metalloregulator ArsR/SmtB family transcription factor [Eubacteriales bacterium]|nr:metalloregulator ArsR/SmtB family transcription factor [Eubacteriales bacterium]